MKDPYEKITIDDGAFYDCASLLKLNIPSTIERVCTNAFGNCVNLISVKVDKKCTRLSGDVFEGCVNLLVDKNSDVYKNCFYDE